MGISRIGTLCVLTVVSSGRGIFEQCRIKVFGGPRLDTIMGPPTVIFRPTVPYTFIGIPAYHPRKMKSCKCPY